MLTNQNAKHKAYIETTTSSYGESDWVWVCIPGENGAWGEFDVADFETGEGDEDEDLDADGFGDEEVSEDDEGNGEEEEEAAEKASGFDGDEHEVRERAPGDEKSAVEVGGDGLTRRRRRRLSVA